METVGALYQDRLLLEARDRTLDAINAALPLFVPGITEDEGRALIKKLLDQRGAEKMWHAPQVRFGVNTLCPFGEKSRPGVRLQENDVFFLDLGPLFNGHEGDVGRTSSVGDDPEMLRLVNDVESIWELVRDRWFTTGESGSELYRFAATAAHERGWLLTLPGANGHRVADFPHVAKRRGSMEKLQHKPAKMRWILEIQIRHPHRPFGAFHEDLLV